MLGFPAEACRLALVLAMDVSSSVNAEEDFLQRQGLASAFLDPNVQAAFFATPDPVALSVFEWSGRYNQEILLDWHLVRSPQDLDQIAQTISNSTRSHNDFPTAMGYALGFGAGLLARAPACAAETLDISGDGSNNEGFGPAEAYAEFPFLDVTVNGLVISTAAYETDIELVEFYAQEVIRGPGAFVEIADGFDSFETTMERKLIRELGVIMIGALE